MTTVTTEPCRVCGVIGSHVAMCPHYEIERLREENERLKARRTEIDDEAFSYAEQLEESERERKNTVAMCEQLRAELDRARTHEDIRRYFGWTRDGRTLIEIIEDMQAELDRAREDAARLDWLESQANVEFSAWPGMTTVEMRHFDGERAIFAAELSARAAIDKARG